MVEGPRKRNRSATSDPYGLKGPVKNSGNESKTGPEQKETDNTSLSTANVASTPETSHTSIGKRRLASSKPSCPNCPIVLERDRLHQKCGPEFLYRFELPKSLKREYKLKAVDLAPMRPSTDSAATLSDNAVLDWFASDMFLQVLGAWRRECYDDDDIKADIVEALPHSRDSFQAGAELLASCAMHYHDKMTFTHPHQQALRSYAKYIRRLTRITKAHFMYFISACAAPDMDAFLYRICARARAVNLRLHHHLLQSFSTLIRLYQLPPSSFHHTLVLSFASHRPPPPHALSNERHDVAATDLGLASGSCRTAIMTQHVRL